MSEIFLENFYIHKLNGEYNVNLEIFDNKKIIVSENGNGKTTILGIFYSFFKKSKKINQYDFEYIKLKIKNDEKEYIFHKGLLGVIFDSEFFQDMKYIDEKDRDKLNKGILKLNKQILNFKTNENGINKLLVPLFVYFCFDNDFNFRKLINSSKNYSDLDILRNKVNQFAIHQFKKIFDEIFSFYRIESIELDFYNLYQDVNKVYEKNNIENTNFDFILNWLGDLNSLIKKFSNKEFLYLTTYRVIEKNINTFKKEDEYDDEFMYFDSGIEGAVNLFKDSPLIQFGMENIKNIWQDLTNKIRSSTTEEFLKLSGTLLKNVVENKRVEESDIQELIDNKASISKVLSRIDQNTFDKKDKENLLSIIEGRKININNKNLALFYILQNMVSIYENQKHIDQAINKYCSAVNKFFENKKIVFNDITSEIYVEINKNKKNIDLEDLSSGEKQIISLFTKLYLTNIENYDLKYWIIYDEPEISLSIEWQELLLPQILKSERCEFILSATHSPFIFKNELKKYTSDLALEVSEI